ncbi:hypothetical protein HanIR_Chr05g0240621 [Helianthus annuus]|nr:hypothetical protein HanIR_Chr05g0240621 [Helianthus annuus]
MCVYQNETRVTAAGVVVGEGRRPSFSPPSFYLSCLPLPFVHCRGSPSSPPTAAALSPLSPVHRDRVFEELGLVMWGVCVSKILVS